MGREIGGTLKKLEVGGDVYLYFLTNHGDVFPIHALPEEGEETATTGVPWTQNAVPMIEAAVKKFYGLRPVDDWDVELRFKMTEAALVGVGGLMQRIPGRKNLVFVTHGVPITGFSVKTNQPVDFTVRLRALAENMEAQQIALYAVQQSMRGAGEALISYGRETLDLLTSLTGGRVYTSDSADVAIRQAMADSRGNYQLAYATEVPGADGKRHKLRVVCARKDVRLHTAEEYYALGLQMSPEEFESAAFQDAANSSTEASEIGVGGKASAGVGGERIDLQIDARDLLLRPGKVFLAFVIGDAGVSSPIPLNVDVRTADGTLSFSKTIPIPPGVKKVRAIVVDRERRAVGSVTIPM